MEESYRGENNRMMFVLRFYHGLEVCIAYPYLLHYLCGDQYDTGSLKSAVESIQQTKAISGHTAADTQEALSYLAPWFHLHIAKSQACLTYSSNDRAQRDLLMREARSHFRKARGAGGAKRTDAVNVRLAMASIWYRSEQYDNSLLWLQRAEQKYTDQVYPTCFCTSDDVKGFQLSLNQKMQDLLTMIRTPPSKLNRFLASCVRFLPSEREIVPVPLQLEMMRSRGTEPGSRNEVNHFWFDWAVVDAKVYLYLLQYLVSVKLENPDRKQEAMENLRVVIEEDNAIEERQRLIFAQLGHKDTAYNLLGWMLAEEGRYNEALRCFLRSLNIRFPHNAAKFHLRYLPEKMGSRG